MAIIRQIELKNIEHEVAGIGKACSNWIVYSRISASCEADDISLAGAAVGDGFDSVLHFLVLGTGSLWPHCGVAGGRWWSRWWRWWRARQSCRLLRQESLLGIVPGFVSCQPSLVVCFRVRVHSPGWNHQSCHQDRQTQHGAESEVGHLHNMMSPSLINTLKQQESWLPATKLWSQIPVHAAGCPRIVWSYEEWSDQPPCWAPGEEGAANCDVCTCRRDTFIWDATWSGGNLNQEVTDEFYLHKPQGGSGKKKGAGVTSWILFSRNWSFGEQG